uniref:Uncharacterized protein n=1 Tax=Caenorhabditis japonica TaxID=281687 RepID=A0A8R1IVK2_CAEJA
MFSSSSFIQPASHPSRYQPFFGQGHSLCVALRMSFQSLVVDDPKRPIVLYSIAPSLSLYTFHSNWSDLNLRQFLVF